MARIHARCVSCGAVDLTSQMRICYPLDRGGKPGYICNDCAERELSYFATTQSKGKEKSELWTVSEEFETSNHTDVGHGNLLANSFEPTHDSSLGGYGIEYKSPVYQGFGGLVKYQKSLEKLVCTGELECDGKCGHHIHIGRTAIEGHLGGRIYDIDAKALDALWAYRYDILVPLGDYLGSNPDKCAKVFGRALGHWAKHPLDAWNSEYRCHDNRYCFINLCTEGKENPSDRYKSPAFAKTIEFRVNRFNNAAQYGRVIMLEKKLVQLMITHFLDYWVIGISGAALKRQAQKLGVKLVAAVKKAAEE